MKTDLKNSCEEGELSAAMKGNQKELSPNQETGDTLEGKASEQELKLKTVSPNSQKIPVSQLPKRKEDRGKKVPENMTSDNFSKLKKVFEFSSTKIFMRMDESTLGHIKGLVGKSMTSSELESIPQQNQGDAVINFGSKKTIRVHFHPNERQLKLFDGGK